MSYTSNSNICMEVMRKLTNFFFVFFSLFCLMAFAVFMINKTVFLTVLQRILEKNLDSVIRIGFISGLMTTFTVGLGHLLIAGSFFFKDKQRKVAIISGFLTGQFVMFFSIYNKTLYKGLVAPDKIICLFLGSFFIQLLWTRLKTFRNTQFLDPEDLLVMEKRRVLQLQLEFMINFFVQICNPYLEPDSLIPRLVDFCLSSYNNDNAKEILFVRSGFAGWLIGNIFFILFCMKLFEFIVIITLWVRKNFFESED